MPTGLGATTRCWCFLEMAGPPGVWLICRVWFRRVCFSNQPLGNWSPQAITWGLPLNAGVTSSCWSMVTWRSTAPECFSYTTTLLSKHRCAVRNTAWTGRETDSRPSGPHSQKRQEDHNETGRNELSGLNLGGPLPQEKRCLRMA